MIVLARCTQCRAVFAFDVNEVEQMAPDYDGGHCRVVWRGLGDKSRGPFCECDDYRTLEPIAPSDFASSMRWHSPKIFGSGL